MSCYYDLVEEFDGFLKQAGDKTLVINYTATWCGPCKIAFPKFSTLSERMTDVFFLRCVGDISPDAKPLLKREGVKSVPAFHIWRSGERQQVIAGSNVDDVESAIKMLV